LQPQDCLTAYLLAEVQVVGVPKWEAVVVEVEVPSFNQLFTLLLVHIR
jgi:hypothetical protein